jgi:hypothetical protein
MFLTMAMFFTAMFDRPIRNWASANLIKQKKLSHFSILLADIPNLESYQRQIAKLPGVDSTEAVDQKTLKLHIEKTMAELGEMAPENFLSTQYSGLKIYLADGISRKSYELIKEYAARLAAEHKVDMTSIVQPSATSKTLWDDRHLMALTMSLIFIGWVASLLVISPKLAQMSYLVERYQRRRKVHFKSLATITAVLFVTSIASAILIDARTINYVLTAAFAVGLTCILTILVPKSRWRQ